jgi:hypothetical protein
MELENTATQTGTNMETSVGMGDEMRQTVKALMEELGVTQNAAAKRIGGISGTTLSQWINGKYPANDSNIVEKVSKWIETEKMRIQSKTAFPPEPDWIETPTSRKVMNVLAFSQMTGHIAVIYGSAGVGKSKGAKRYTLLNPNAWMATMSPQISSVGAALEEIAEAVGLKDIPSRAARVHRELKKALTGTKGLLIIDEAQHLSVEVLDAIRSIHDAVEGMVGLAFIGNDRVYSQLTGGGKRSLEFAQLFSRIGKKQSLQRPTQGDVEALVKHFGIEGNAELSFLKELAQKPGALRGMTYTMQLASVFAMGESEKIRLCHLQDAWKDLVGGA